MSETEELKERLFLNKQNGWSGKSTEEKDEIFRFADEYMYYLNNGKTEKEIVEISKEILIKNGFRDISEMNESDIGLDLGDKTINHLESILKCAKIVMWNGPLGYYEIEKYQHSTKEILKFLTENSIETILGGGDIVAASANLGYKEKVSHASTGGGATLEYLEGKKLPGLEIIDEK